jgi:hypothetical protein
VESKTARRRKTQAQRPAESSSEPEEGVVYLDHYDENVEWGEVTDNDTQEECIS